MTSFSRIFSHWAPEEMEETVKHFSFLDMITIYFGVYFNTLDTGIQ